MDKPKREIVGCMKKYHSFYKLYDGSPMPNWNYNIKATIDSGIEIPYYDFNGNGRLDKANEKMWLNALIRQVETGFNNLNNDQLDRLKYENSKDKIDYNVGSYRKITVLDVVRILNSGE